MATTAPTTAIGYTQAPTYSQLTYEDETTPELQWPQSVAVYDQMRRTDSQCASVLRAVTLPVRRTPWRIDPNGARAEVVELVADDLGLPIVGQGPRTPPRAKDRFSWSEHLRLALLMLPLGHSFFEQLYRVEPDGSRAHLRKLEWRPSKSIEDIKVAPDGGLISIKQYWTRTDTEPKPIPVSRLVAYVHEREGGNWLGSSVLRSAYKNWLLKDRLLRVQAQTIERNGMGIPLYKGQEDATAADLAAGKAMATAWRAGEAAGSAIPFGADLVLRGVEGTLPDADPVIRYHDEQIARAVLAHFLNLGTQTGSWALGTTFADFFTLSLQTLAQQIADTATQHIIEDLVDINFGESEPAPRLVFDEIGSRQAATAQAMKLLVDAGLITPDAVLDENLRQQYGLPPADPATATPPPAQAPPSPAPEPEPVPGEGSVAASAGDSGMAGLLSQALSIVAHGTHNQKDHGRRLPKPGNIGGSPFADFSREQLRKAARRRGIELERGESRDSIERKLARHLTESDDLKDVTLEPLPHRVYGETKAAFEVQLGGINIGAVQEDLDGNWKAIPRGGDELAHFVPPPKKATKEQAIKALVDADKATAVAQRARKDIPVSAAQDAMVGLDSAGVNAKAGPSPVVAHQPGGHNQKSHGNSVSSPNALGGFAVMDADRYASVYGQAYDDDGIDLAVEAETFSLNARSFESGDLHVVIDLEDGKAQVLEDMDPESMRQLADDLDAMADVDETEYTADAYEVVDDINSGMHDFYAAKYGGGDIRLAPGASESDYLELTEGQARKFAEALRNIADGHEEREAEREVVAKRAARRAARVAAHGMHDQSKHGRKKASLPSLAAPKAAPKPPDTPAKQTPAKKAPAKKAPAKKASPRNKPAPRASREDALRASLATGVKEERKLSGGRIGDVRLATLGDGSQAVLKTNGGRRASDLDIHRTDADVLASSMAEVLGMDAPAAVKTDNRTVAMTFVDDALTAYELDDANAREMGLGSWGSWMQGVVDSDAGRRMGLLDLLIENRDRNEGNFMARRGGALVAIDHGGGWEVTRTFFDGGDPERRRRIMTDTARSAVGLSDFTDPYVQRDGGVRYIDNDLTPADIAHVRSGLEGLRPRFEELGRGEWLDFSLARLEVIGSHAKGTRNRVAP